MKLSKLWMLATILTFCGLCLLTSCSEEDNPVVVPTGQGAELRSKLQSLDWGSDTCYVYGHKTPDVDAVCSALSYARLMRALGYNCKAKVSSPINQETAFVASHFGFQLPELKTSVAPHTRLILTDHADYVQCVDGGREAVILQVIDHHPDGEIADAVPFLRRELVGSTNTIIFQMYHELGVPIDDETAGIMLAGLVSDTKNLAKAGTCAADTLVWEALTAQLGISPDSMAVISKRMKDASKDISDMSDKQIFLSDYKGYEYNGYLYGMGNVDIKVTDIDDLLDRMLAVMPEVMSENGLDMIFAKVEHKVKVPDPSKPDGNSSKTVIYFLYYGEGAREVAEGIFGASLRAGITYSDVKLSRKQIVPLIEEQLR